MHNHDIFGHNEKATRTVLSFSPTSHRNVDLASHKTYHDFCTLLEDFNGVFVLEGSFYDCRSEIFPKQMTKTSIIITDA